MGKVPTISIDKTDGCQMYLSQSSLETEIISSKSSEMNVMVPKPNGDYVSNCCQQNPFNPLTGTYKNHHHQSSSYYLEILAFVWCTKMNW